MVEAKLPGLAGDKIRGTPNDALILQSSNRPILHRKKSSKNFEDD